MEVEYWFDICRVIPDACSMFQENYKKYFFYQMNLFLHFAFISLSIVKEQSGTILI